MKNILFLLCMITWVWSCSSASEEATDDPTNNPPDQPKEYIVSLGMAGEILDIEESPLSKASGNDLYGVQVYSKTANTNYTPYAYGLFDDKSLMTIKLLEGYNYKFQVTMVVDGKNKLFWYNGNYSYPFYTSSSKGISLTNLFLFDNKDNLEYIEKGMTYLAGYSGKIYSCPNTDRYYGELEDYLPSESGNISINMKRVSFGAKFIAEGLTEGKLKINIQESPELNIIYGNTEIQDIFTFTNKYPYSSSELKWTNDNYSETIPVSISWEKADRAIVPLINKEIVFKRNVLTTITIKVKDTSINNGIDITQESGEMTKGEDIVLESGTGLDGNIDPVEK